MNLQDIVVGAITAWKENRQGGTPGMQSVLNVLVNRATKRGTSVYEEALRPEQFSSMTTPGDPELGIGPNALVAADWQAFLTALSLASQAANGGLADITGGATSYYAASIPAPYWVASMTFTCEIAGQRFFR